MLDTAIFPTVIFASIRKDTVVTRDLCNIASNLFQWSLWMGQQPQLRTKAFLHRIPKRQSFSKKVQCGGKASLIAFRRIVRDYCRGRWFSFGIFTCFLFIVISRPAFGRLCGRIFSLILKLFFRRFIGLLSVIVDSVLEETVVHLEEALTSTTEAIPMRDTSNHGMQPSTVSFSQFLLNGLCVLLGSLLHRTFQRAAPAVHPIPP